MAKAGTILGLGAIALGIFYLTRKTKGAKALEFYPESVDLSKVSFTNWVPDLLVRVVNPSYAAQQVDAVFLNIYSGEIHLGRIQISKPFEIPKLIDTVIKMPVTIFPAGTGKIIGKVIKGEKIPLTIKGTVSSMGVSIPIEQKLS